MKFQSLTLSVLSLLCVGHAYVLSTDCPSDSRSSSPENPLLKSTLVGDQTTSTEKPAIVVENATDHTTRYIERALLKSKIDEAFARVDRTARELHKVDNNAPDKIQAVADTAAFLFNPGDYKDIVSNLGNLYDKSRFSTKPDPKGPPAPDIDLVDSDVLPFDVVSARSVFKCVQTPTNSASFR